MYHFLEVTEILEEIIEFAISSLGGRAAILSLSATCRSLRDPSLDHFWRTQESLTPLLRFIPPRPCVEEVRGIGGISRTYAVAAEGPSDWSSFIKNAARIQNLKIHFACLRVAHLLHDLNEDRPTPLLLPNIGQLKWHRSEELLGLVHLFLGPKLSSFSLEIIPDRGVHDSDGLINPHIITAAPFLTEVQFYCCESSSLQSLSKGLSDLVCRMSRLRIFSDRYHDYTSRALFHLASISTLREVTLTDSTTVEATKQVTRNSNEPSFRTLQEITTTLPGPFIINDQIFKIIQSSQLKKVTLHVLKITAESLRNFLSTLSFHPSASSLSILSFRSRNDTGLQQPEYRADFRITLETLQPLLTLAGLECLDMSDFPFLDLGDDDLKAIVMSLPRLQTLNLGTTYGWKLSPRITLLGLAPLAEYCPALTQLGIAVDTNPTIPASDIHASMVPPNSNLHSLNLSNSKIEPSQVLEIAALLSELFPSLGYIAGFDLLRLPTLEELLRVNREERISRAQLGKSSC